MKPAILALVLFPSFAIAQTPSLSSPAPCPRINANSPPRPKAAISSLKTSPIA